jgi:Uma2 family endonuclease
MSTTARVHHRFSVDDYEQMIAQGILTEEDRCELIRGEILAKMTIGDRHAACVNRLTRILTRMLGERAIVSVQNPIRLADSEPEPDVALLRARGDFYESGKPRAVDVWLVIEVGDATLEFDRSVKVPLYAENGIGECWVVNLIEDVVEVYRDPEGPHYREGMRAGRGEELALPVGLGGVVRVDEVL